MKLFLFKNSDKIQSFEPDAFVRVKIGEDWKELGTATKGTTPKGTAYYEMEVDEDVLIEKLADIDWQAKGEKTAQFLKHIREDQMNRSYPEYTAEKTMDEKFDEA